MNHEVQTWTLWLLAVFSIHATGESSPLVDAGPLVPGAVLDIRYAGPDNFMGRPLEGYLAPKCLLTPQAARALADVQTEVAVFGLNLVIYDCYRPQRAVDHFMRWSKDPGDIIGKESHYPRVPKSRLVAEGYIAEKSGHSRGSTVDLTLAYSGGEPLDMGTAWDFFDSLSNTDNPQVSRIARANRLLLRSVMAVHGFANFPGEWWHFTLEAEPLPDSYLDEPVQ